MFWKTDIFYTLVRKRGGGRRNFCFSENFAYIITKWMTSSWNTSIYDFKFRETLNYAEITPGFKDVDEISKSNNRTINVLPSKSIIFEKIHYAQIEKFMDN